MWGAIGTIAGWAIIIVIFAVSVGNFIKAGRGE